MVPPRISEVCGNGLIRVSGLLPHEQRCWLSLAALPAISEMKVLVIALLTYKAEVLVSLRVNISSRDTDDTSLLNISFS